MQKVTADTNAELGTSYSADTPYHKAAKLTVDHKVSYEIIAEALSKMLNKVHKLTAPTDFDVENEVKLYSTQFLDPLFDKPSGATVWDNATIEQDARLALGILEATLKTTYAAMFASRDTDDVCDAADAYLVAVNSSIDNVRNGDARVNFAIQEFFDPSVIATTGGQEQWTPRTKRKAKSEYRELTGVCLTPSGNHYLSSSFCTSREVGNLTPDSRSTMDDMKGSKRLKSKKWSK